MCGIFGVVVKNGKKYPPSLIRKVIEGIATNSESRGKDSSGFCIMDQKRGRYEIIRSATPITSLLKESEYTSNIEKVLSDSSSSKTSSTVVIGHSRLVTNGTQLNDDNNQPVIKDGIIGIHNGIIVNNDHLWDENKELERDYEIDTEVMLALIRNRLNEFDLNESVVSTIKDVFGTIATALLFTDLNEMVLVTNNGSLYLLDNGKDFLVFASEKYMLQKLKDDLNLVEAIGRCKIRKVYPNNGYFINLDTVKITHFTFDKKKRFKPSKLKKDYQIKLHDLTHKDVQLHAVIDIETLADYPKAKREKKLLENNSDRISKLKRCKRCVLPETFPFIEFDKKGVCNYCNNYVKKNKPHGIKELKRLVEPYRSNNGEPDIIIPFSGGRDSSFVLHFVKTELELNPIAYTYDWGMVTDLARRNIARVCGTLGVENIIVSADIKKKRDNIRKNVLAWMKKPHLGVIPLFMAGDKYFFYYCSKLKEQTGIDLNIWGVNNLENTDFKAGFVGLKPKHDKKYIYSLSKFNQMKLFGFIFRNIVLNPAYVNSSVFDTFGSYLVRYVAPKKDYFHFFDYYQWNEDEIVDTLIQEYDWETATDTEATWRIGDGTASFYNYIYYTMAGFTESDSFRSNQVREGMITRKEALRLIEIENRPRFETIKWYLEIVGLDYTDVIKRINESPKLYR